MSRATDGLADWFRDNPTVKAALAAHADALRAATSSPDSIVQAHAASALEKMGERAPSDSMLRASSSALRRRGIVQASSGDRSAAPLLIELSRNDPELVVRLEAIPVTAQLATPEQRDALLGVLVADPDDHVAARAIQAAGATKAVALAKKIELIVAGPEGERTEVAIAALALGDTAAVPMIAAHLNDRVSDTK